ncbi:DNA repair protein RadA [Halofilum ochraceum]|uniref:DNA repair protein RadA n=1 Tax=Halofilum ochraceum TaxID=1611323 RepID=UPI000831DFD3|nr:DNA repair protein RadA [Halofilum ochraceum]
MARQPKSLFRCESCGAEAPKWAGQCADCGAWNTLVEVPTGAASGTGRGGRRSPSAAPRTWQLQEVSTAEDPRHPTGLAELDRVLGGGLVPGSVILLGGDPGIGKSTLLLQTLASLAADHRVLYVTGEESLSQVTLRARRLGVEGQDVRLLAETGVERILDAAAAESPGVLVIDSIQTMMSEEVQSAPGGVAQVRESASRLVRYAKDHDVALFLVGHVTKEGTLAGPRVLEHMVDTVVYFEGDGSSRWRMVRAIKNRFGAVNELGVFAMGDRGLKPVANPSAIFLSRHEEPVAGSIILVTREGTRPLLVEIQALVDDSALSNPRRVALGLEQNRLSMLLAVLHRHAGVAMQDQDVYVNAVGGVRIAETAADLAVLGACISSFRDRPLPTDLVVFGEVGLAGEIRPVPNGEERLNEAAKHGFTRAIVPRANAPRRAIEGMTVEPVGRLAEVLDLL